jgi:PAS domain S-box-containing protein
LDWYIIRNIVNFVLASIFGLVVFYKNPRNKANILYMLFCFAVAYWDFVDFNIYLAKSYDATVFWAKLDFAATTMGTAFLTHFMLEFSKVKKLLDKKIIIFAIYLPVIFFSVYDLFTHKISGEIVISDSGRDLVWGSDTVNYISGGWSVVMTFLGVYSFLLFFRRSLDNSFKKQARIILFGFLFSFLSTAVEGFTWAFESKIPSFFIFGLTVEFVVIGVAMLRSSLFTLNPVTAAESIISTMSDSLLLISPDKLIMGVNDSMLKVLGYKKQELIGNNAGKILQNLKIDGGKGLLTLIFKKDNLTDIESFLLTKKGVKVPVSLSTSLVKRKSDSAKASILGVVAICRDIRERKKIESETMEYSEKLKKLNKKMVDREIEMIELKRKIQEAGGSS